MWGGGGGCKGSLLEKKVRTCFRQRGAARAGSEEGGGHRGDTFHGRERRPVEKGGGHNEDAGGEGGGGVLPVRNPSFRSVLFAWVGGSGGLVAARRSPFFPLGLVCFGREVTDGGTGCM